jgi:hypothetical protein
MATSILPSQNFKLPFTLMEFGILFHFFFFGMNTFMCALKWGVRASFEKNILETN